MPPVLSWLLCVRSETTVWYGGPEKGLLVTDGERKRVVKVISPPRRGFFHAQGT